jgi:TRAP-type C4-dicarboxylate transport system permease small subunit
MLTGSVVVVALLALLALAVTFFVARRALKLFVRLALLFVFLLLLLGGYVWWRLQGPSETAPARNDRRTTTTAPRR